MLPTTEVERQAWFNRIGYRQALEEKPCCITCHFALYPSRLIMFWMCSLLKKWTLKDFRCKYHRARTKKNPKKGHCVYFVEGKEYSHPKNCEKCLMNPETCTKSPQYNSNWDPKRGRWITQEEEG